MGPRYNLSHNIYNLVWGRAVPKHEVVVVHPDVAPAKCQFHIGDGTGADEEKIKHLTKNRKQCILECWGMREEDPSINGVTINVLSEKNCYCEKHMDDINKYSFMHMSCMFQKGKEDEVKEGT